MTEEATINSTIVNSPETDHGTMQIYDRNKIIFWGLTALYLCVALLAAVGNGLVLFAAYGNRNCGPLRILDSVIKSLAMTDMLYGLIGMPCRLIGMCYEGRYV